MKHRPDNTEALLVRRSSGTASPVTTFAANDSIREISWSPDGSKLAVAVQTVGTSGAVDGASIYRVTVATGARTALVTETNMTNRFIDGADWQPGGNLIAYTQMGDIFTVSASGGDPINRTNQVVFHPGWTQPSGKYSYEDLDWAPSGDRLVAVIGEDKGCGVPERYVGVVALWDPVPTTKLAVVNPACRWGWHASVTPLWSPDGSLVALESSADGVSVVPAGSGPARHINASWGGPLDWQPCPGGVCARWGVTVPAPPTIGSASPGPRGGKITATAKWQRPTDTGGEPLRAFKVTAMRLSSTGAVVAKKTATRPPSSVSYTMPLTKGRYRFRVAAINSVGRSKWSARSNIVRAR